MAPEVDPAEIERRMDEHPELIQRLKDGDASALEDLLEVCTGAKVATVTVRHFV